MKKILITGNSGYIGSHLTKVLEDEYLLSGMDKNEPKVPIKNFAYSDITTPVGMGEEFDCVIHLAASVNVGESMNLPTSYYMTNLIGTLNVLHGIKTKHFIFASTGAAEGCLSPYGVSKRAAEDCVIEYCTKNKIDYTIFRFYNVIGGNVVEPTNPDGLFYNLYKAKDIGNFTIFGDDYATKDGTCERDYVHVNEICNSIKYAVQKPSNSIENLGHGEGHTVKEMAELYKTVNNLNFEIKYSSRRPGDLASSVLKNRSLYMKKVYSLEDLLKVDK
jgi:UDP-glucose 4-epimerase